MGAGWCLGTGARSGDGEVARDLTNPTNINAAWLEGQPTPKHLWLKKPSAFKAHLNSYSRSCHLIYQVTAVF